MSAAPLSLRAVGLLCLSVSFGCAGLKPADTSSGLSPLAQDCSAPQEALDDLQRVKRCLQAFDEAAARQDARSAGQALLIWSRYQDGDKRSPWIKLSLWLNPQPWLPEQSGWSAAALEEHQVERLSLGDAQAIRFEGSKPLGHIKTYLVPIKLPAHPSIEALPIKLAAAIGAPAVFADNKLLSATPTLAALTRATSELDMTDIARAKALANADKQLASGEQLAAGASLLAAIEDSDESLKPCGALAMSRYTLYIIGQSIFINGHKGYLDEIAARCASTTAGDKSAIKDPYWSAITALERGADTELLNTLREPHGVEAYMAATPKELTSAQRQWISLLASKLKLLDARFNPSAQGLCKGERPERQSPEQVKALIKQLQEAQRHDLAQQIFVNMNVSQKLDGTKKLTALLSELNALRAQPMPAWQGPAGQQALLNALPAKLSPLERVLLQPQCLRYEDYITQQAYKDRGQGASQRASERLLEMTRHQHLCSASALRPLAEQTIDALMRDEQGRLNVAKLLGQLSIESLQLILQGKADSIFQIMTAMMPKLAQLEQSLTDAPADLTLGSLLGIVRQLAQQVQPPELLKQLEQGLADLDRALKAPPGPKDDALLQYAPTLRLLFQHMLLTTRVVFGTGDPKVEIARIEKTLEQDLRVTMRLFEQDPALASALAAHLRAIYSTSLLITAPSAAALTQELQKAELLPASKAKKWWPLATSSVQLGLLSAQAWVAHNLNEEDLRQRALLSASKVLEQMITRGLEDFEGQGSNWALLKLLVPAYELGAKELISPEDTASTMALMMQRLPEFERAAKLIIGDIEAHTKVMSSSPNFVDLFVDLLKVALKVGMINIYDPVNDTLSQAARTQLSRDLEQTSKRYSPKLQVYIYAMVAFLRGDDLKASMNAITTASKIGEGTSEAYLPALLALRLHGQGWAKPKETLTLMDQVLEMTRASEQCQAQQSLIALYPQRAKLLDLLGRHDEASKTRLEYLDSLKDGETGEVTLSCQINASKGYVKATFNLTFPTSTLGFPTDTEQEVKADNELSTFQLGLGFSSVVEDSEKLECTLQRSPITQLAQTYQVYLDQALISLWRGAHAESDQALGMLLYLNHKLLYTQGHAMQQQGAGITRALQWIDLAQLKWMITLAQLRGYWQVARQLNDSYTQLHPRSSRAAAQQQEPPKLVQSIKGLIELKPLVDQLYPEAEQQTSVKALGSAWAKLKTPAGMSALNLTLLELAVASRQGDFTLTKQLVDKLQGPLRAEIDPNLLASILTWTDGSERVPAKMATMLEGLSKSDFSAESAALISAYPQNFSRESLRGLLLSERKSLLMAKIFASGLLMQKLNEEPKPAELIAQWSALASDFTDWESVANARYGQVKLLAKDAKWAQSAQALGELNGKLAESLPLNHPTLLDLLILQLALSGLANEDINATLEAMNIWVNTLADAPDEHKETLQSWTAQRDAPAKLKTSMMAHVKKGLGI